MIKLKDDFLRKYRLGIDEVQKFFRAEEKRKEPMQKRQLERLDKGRLPERDLIRTAIYADCVLIGTV